MIGSDHWKAVYFCTPTSRGSFRVKGVGAGVERTDDVALLPGKLSVQANLQARQRRYAVLPPSNPCHQRCRK
jgi:hypothetical protein